MPCFVARKQGLPRDPRYSDNQVKSVACMGLTLQIVIMYIGCFFVRTFDTFSVSEELHKRRRATGSGLITRWFITARTAVERTTLGSPRSSVRMPRLTSS